MTVLRLGAMTVVGQEVSMVAVIWCFRKVQKNYGVLVDFRPLGQYVWGYPCGVIVLNLLKALFLIKLPKVYPK